MGGGVKLPSSPSGAAVGVFILVFTLASTYLFLKQSTQAAELVRLNEELHSLKTYSEESFSLHSAWRNTYEGESKLHATKIRDVSDSVKSLRKDALEKQLAERDARVADEQVIQELKTTLEAGKTRLTSVEQSIEELRAGIDEHKRADGNQDQELETQHASLSAANVLEVKQSPSSRPLVQRLAGLAPRRRRRMLVERAPAAIALHLLSPARLAPRPATPLAILASRPLSSPAPRPSAPRATHGPRAEHVHSRRWQHSELMGRFNQTSAVVTVLTEEMIALKETLSQLQARPQPSVTARQPSVTAHCRSRISRRMRQRSTSPAQHTLHRRGARCELTTAPSPPATTTTAPPPPPRPRTAPAPATAAPPPPSPLRIAPTPPERRRRRSAPHARLQGTHSQLEQRVTAAAGGSSLSSLASPPLPTPTTSAAAAAATAAAAAPVAQAASEVLAAVDTATLSAAAAAVFSKPSFLS